MNIAVWFPVLAGFAWKSSAVLGMACLLSLVLRSRSAALRHIVWTAAAAAVLALPLFSISLPALRVPSFARLAPGVAALFVTNAAAQPETTPIASPQRRVPATVHAEAIHLDWRRALLLAWMIGAAAKLAQLLVAFAGLWRTRRSATRSPYAGLARELANGRTVPVLETPERTMPMTCGFLRPAILLPLDAQTWTEERRRVVLLHELAHVQRGDVAVHMLARLALIPNWWNPLAWFAWREFLKERERAADDLVLATGARASDYAAHLLEVARSMHSSPALAGAAVGMARRSQLEGRLAAILDSRTNRRSAGRASVVTAVVAAIALAAPFAAVRAQDKASQVVPSDVVAMFRAAFTQGDYEMIDKPAAALEAQRQFDDARKLLDAALTIREQVSGSQSVAYGIGLMNIGELEKRRARRPDEAVAFYTKAAQVLGDRSEAAPALMFLGMIQLGKKEYAQAIDYFTRAQNLDWQQQGPAQMWMALVRWREQNPAEADALFRSALAVEDPNSDQAATTMEMYSEFLKEQRREGEAKTMLDRATAMRRVPAPVSTVPKIGGGIVPPKLLFKVEPEYTVEARLAKYWGTVVLWLEVGSDGLAHNIQVIKGLGFGLDQNAIAAISEWRFQPASKDGAPQAVIANVEVNFRLR